MIASWIVPFVVGFLCGLVTFPVVSVSVLLCLCLTAPYAPDYGDEHGEWSSTLQARPDGDQHR